MADVGEPKKEYRFPGVVVREIFRQLGARDAWAVSQTCVLWRSIGVSGRKEMRNVRVSDFYADLITEERFIEYPVFHRREDLSGLILVRTSFVKKLVKWLRALYPNVTELVFRNYVRRSPSAGAMAHPSRFHVFVINELMSYVGRCWPRLEMLDISGEIIDVRSLHHVKHWINFREIRISGADLSYNMLTIRHLVLDALTKTFWTCPLGAIRLSNLEINFEMTFTRMTMFKASNNRSLTTGWLNAFLKEAVNLRSLAIDCVYVHDENILLMGNLVDLRELTLRNCIHVNDFSPLGNLPALRSAVIDFGDKGTEEQMCQIIKGSKNWRRVIFNELVEQVGNRFLETCADHFRFHSCPLVEFELNTEKTNFKCVDHDWVLPGADAVGIKAILEACPLLETFGICTRSFDDARLLEVAERCLRIRVVVVNDSGVTDEGVLLFYETLRRNRSDRFFGAASGGCFVNVRCAQCTANLLEEARERFGDELKIAL